MIRLLAALACGRRPELGDVSLEELLPVAGRLGLVSLLGDALAEAGHPEARRAVAAGLMQAAARERLLDLLVSLVGHGATGPPILIKGGALLVGGVLTHRDMADLDVVVPPEAIASWRSAAKRAGATWKDGVGYEAGAIYHSDGMIEVHAALPGFVGNDPGPACEVLARHAVASPMPDILVPTPQVSREIAVQHFVFHHAGETAHALRVLQDLAALEREPDGKGLDWGRPGVAEATESLRVIVRQVRDGHDHEEPAHGYLEALAGALEADTHPTFAEDVGRWIEDRPGLSGKAALIVRHIFPPLEQMRATEDEPTTRTLARYLTRPFRLVAKYVGGRSPADPAAQRWKRELERLR